MLAQADMNQDKSNFLFKADSEAVPESDCAPVRCISIDVEEYFQIEAAHDVVGPKRWDDWPSRVERNMDLLLELFDRTGCRATFFFLGSIAERHPKLAASCVELGHEVASHGSMHDRLHRLTPESMLKDVRDSKQVLEDQTGRQVLGYRAPHLVNHTTNKLGGGCAGGGRAAL